MFQRGKPEEVFFLSFWHIIIRDFHIKEIP